MLAARPEANSRRKVSLEVYDRMWAAGQFEARRVELLDGEVVEMSPVGTPHAEALRRLTRHLVLALVDLPRLAVDVQIPVRIPNDWEPVPDFAITTRLPSPRPGAAPESRLESSAVPGLTVTLSEVLW